LSERRSHSAQRSGKAASFMTNAGWARSIRHFRRQARSWALDSQVARAYEEILENTMPDTIAASSVGKRPARVWRIALGAVLLLIGIINSAKVKTAPGDLAGALGALTGVVTLVALAVWLIASGLPKSIGSEDLKRLRRRIWYKLAGLGLLVMILLAVGLAAASQFTAAVLVTWAYWFGWTWISWRIADKRALRQLQRPTA